MKILLAACNAKYIHSNLAVYQLKAYAEKFAGQILLREYTINQQMDDILRDIYNSGAQVICFSCYIWNISFVKEIMGELPKILPGVILWAGGPEVSFNSDEILRENPWITGVMAGEGERTFYELAEFYLEQKGDLSQIKGIIYRAGQNIICNPPRQLTDLSEIPFAGGDLENFSNRIIYYESSRGCPFSCSYCLSSVDKTLRFRSLELVKKELDFFLDKKVPQVKFVDRTFNCRHSHSLEIWKFLKENDNGITNFHFEISADILTEQELEIMETMRPGLIQLEIGVQSTNPDTLKAIKRSMDLEKLKKNVRRIYKYGNIHQHLDLIAGLPYEDYDSFRKSFNEIYELKPHQLQLGFLKVLKGSYMMECVREYGIQYKRMEPYEVLSTNWLSYEDILRLKTVESMVEVYYNSGQFQYTRKCLEPYFSDPFGFYETLGMFYLKKGYQELSHSRIRRYEILLEFVQECTEIPEADVKDAMLYDLYLRENLKSRPSFAFSQKPWEKEIWEYRRENNIPKTAHIEVFRNNKVILFDYSRRSPLTNNAHTEEVILNGNI